MRTIIVLLISSFLFFSCEKNLIQEAVSDENFELQTIKPSIKDNAVAIPAQPGDNMKVYRGETTWAWVFNDADKGIQAFVNVDIHAYCFGEPSFGWIDFQAVVQQDEESYRELVQFKGDDVDVTVWNNFGPIDCPYYFENDPLFSGVGDFVYTDNDLSPDDNISNSNSWGMTLHGDGVVIVARFTFNPKKGVYRPYVNIMLK